MECSWFCERLRWGGCCPSDSKRAGKNGKKWVFVDKVASELTDAGKALSLIEAGRGCESSLGACSRGLAAEKPVSPIAQLVERAAVNG